MLVGRVPTALVHIQSGAIFRALEIPPTANRLDHAAASVPPIADTLPGYRQGGVSVPARRKQRRRR